MRVATLGWAMGLSATVTLLAALGWGLSHPANKPPKSIVGQRAPDLTIQALQGGEVKLSSFRGTPLVVNFWASWCVPCRQEAPVLNSGAREHAGRVQFLGVDIQDTDQAARAYQADVQSPYPVGLAVRGSYRDWGVTAPPETFFLDRRGVVISTIVGPVDAKRLEIYLSQLGP
jgi:cytochrome c biogenesis protein CcmG, thiol:disulfide interchange protein DsbE